MVPQRGYAHHTSSGHMTHDINRAPPLFFRGKIWDGGLGATAYCLKHRLHLIKLYFNYQTEFLLKS